MSEIINVYDKSDLDKSFPTNRDDFYKEAVEYYKENWEHNWKYVEVVNVFLINVSWEIILQKRSSSKGHNSNLMDKSIWGHIVHWDSPNFTVMLETVQELQVPSIVLKDKQDFYKTFFVLKDYLTSTSIIKSVDTFFWVIPKKINWELIEVWNKTHLYLWIYWGSVKNVDKEAKWILFYSLEELEAEMEETPELFTNDLHFYLKKHRTEIVDFINFIKENNA